MELNEFIQEYGEYVRMYKEYENGVIHIKFDNPGKIVWLKGVICENMDMHVKSSTPGKSYWFAPN